MGKTDAEIIAAAAKDFKEAPDAMPTVFKSERWGTAGSGILYICPEDQTILLFKRSRGVKDPGTWGITGGAIKGTDGIYDTAEITEAHQPSVEESRKSAETETKEELGLVPKGKTAGQTVFKDGHWQYTTFIVAVSPAEKKRIESNAKLNWENDELSWHPLTQLPSPLHFGVKFTLDNFDVSAAMNTHGVGDQPRHPAGDEHGGEFMAKVLAEKGTTISAETSDAELIQKTAAEWDESEHPRQNDGKFTESGNASTDAQQVKLSPERIEELKKDPTVFWHGTASGELRGGTQGLHVGTHQAAKEALEATIGIRADGKDWDGTEEYGKTKLMGQRRQNEIEASLRTPENPYVCYGGTGHNCKAPQEDYYPSEHPEGLPKYSNGDSIPLTVKPTIFPVRIKGDMTNSPERPMSDTRANATMRAQMKKGATKRGYYYTNDGEDSGSISAVVPPGGKHLDIIVKSQDVELVGEREPSDAAIVEAVAKEFDERQSAETVAKDAEFEAEHPRDGAGKFEHKGEDTGASAPTQLRGTPYEKAVQANLRHMQSKIGDKEMGKWKAVEIVGIHETKDDRGEDIQMPVFKMPEGYGAAPTLYESGGDGLGCCGWCGHPIKMFYHIQNDTQKWTLGVGSECITQFTEGKSGKDMAKEVKQAENRQLLRDAIATRKLLATAFRYTDYSGYHSRQEWAFPEASELHRALQELTGAMKADKAHAMDTPETADSQVASWVTRKGDEVRNAMLKVDAMLQTGTGALDRARSIIERKVSSLNSEITYKRYRGKELLPYEIESRKESVKKLQDAMDEIRRRSQPVAKSDAELIAEVAKDFDPGKHPRDEHGRWAATQGGELSSQDKVALHPGLQKWFGNSVVTESGVPGGKPKVMFHATNTTDIAEFRPYTHFGTAKAANDRFDSLRDFSENVVGRDAGRFNVIPVYIKLENPLRMPDLAELDSNSMEPLVDARQRFEEKYPDKEEREQRDENREAPRAAAWESETDLSEYLYRNDVITEDEFWDVQYSPTKAMELLKEKGYDGIVYNNAVEDPGNDSYIVFSPEQVKSAVGNRGTYSETEKDITKTDAELIGEVAKDFDESKHHRDAIGRFSETEAAGESIKPGIDTPEFKAWFGNSKIVDKKGRPLVVYHGTPNPTMTEFQTDTNRPKVHNETSSMGAWFTDNPKTAAGFAEGERTEEFQTGEKWEDGELKTFRRTIDTVGGLVPVYLSMKNPKVYERFVPDAEALARHRESEKALADAETERSAVAARKYPEEYVPGDYQKAADKVAAAKEKLAIDAKAIREIDSYERMMDDRDRHAEYINASLNGVPGAWRQRYMAFNTEKTNTDFVNELKAAGHDGIIIRGTVYDSPRRGKTVDQYVVFDPTQIKSVFNRGSWSQSSPHISKSDAELIEQVAKDAEFEEKHPRGEAGKFEHKGEAGHGIDLSATRKEKDVDRDINEARKAGRLDWQQAKDLKSKWSIANMQLVLAQGLRRDEQKQEAAKLTEFTGKGSGLTAAEKLKEFEKQLDASHPGWRVGGGMSKLPHTLKNELFVRMGDKFHEEQTLKSPPDITGYHNESDLKRDLLYRVVGKQITEKQAEEMLNQFRELQIKRKAEQAAEAAEKKAKHGELADAGHKMALEQAEKLVGFKPATTIEEANRSLNSMGVAGAFKRGQVGLANVTNAALAIAKSKGDPLPMRMEVQARSGATWMASLSYVTYKQYTGKLPENVLYINSAKAAQASWKEAVDAGWWSQINPVLHEIGHQFHLANNKQNYITWSNTQKFVKIYGEERKTAEKVSRYAATSPTEFVAETYAGIRAGKTYSDDVKALFKKLSDMECPS